MGLPGPYYDHAGITIYNSDCRDILPFLDPVDLVLTDPPYNAKNIGPNKRVYEGSIMCLPEDEYRQFCLSWFSLVQATNIIFTPGISNICAYPQPYWVLCWHKPAAVSFNRMGGYNAWEPVFVYGKPFKRLPQDYIYANTLKFTKGPEKNHPCPKPLSLWNYLLSLTEAQTVLDPFLGSGTTLITAKQLGRKAIGIEIEERYCQIAAERLRQEVLPL
jgi:DNA modification methylase